MTAQPLSSTPIGPSTHVELEFRRELVAALRLVAGTPDVAIDAAEALARLIEEAGGASYWRRWTVLAAVEMAAKPEVAEIVRLANRLGAYLMDAVKPRPEAPDAGA